jgi:hypothetical protein
MAMPSTDTDELASFVYKQELNGRGATPSVSGYAPARRPRYRQARRA